MNILLVIDAELPVAVYGGTERVMWYLGKELAKMKHNVTFLARHGTQCDFAKTISINHEIALEKQIPENIDVVHFNDYRPHDISKPYIITFHGNHTGSELIDQNTVFVSRNHAERHSATAFVYNGLDWDDYGEVDYSKPRQYFHFLGKAAWRVKNVKGAIDVIKAIPGAQLNVLGGVRFNFKMGMRFTFTPKARFKGMVGGGQKLDLLKGSQGLIFPVRWDEPFGLAITESLYCGAPVFGTPYGSLPELITKETGFLTASKHEMAAHIINEYNYSPKVCHEYARDMFNSRQMAEAYITKYEMVIDGKTLNEKNPLPSISDRKKSWNL